MLDPPDFETPKAIERSGWGLHWFRSIYCLALVLDHLTKVRNYQDLVA